MDAPKEKDIGQNKVWCSFRHFDVVQKKVKLIVTDEVENFHVKEI